MDTTLRDQIKTQAIAVDIAEFHWNNATDVNEHDAYLDIWNAECQKLNALWKLARLEVVA